MWIIFTEPIYSPLNDLCLWNIVSEGYYLGKCSCPIGSLDEVMERVLFFVCLSLSLVLVKRRQDGSEVWHSVSSRKQGRGREGPGSSLYLCDHRKVM